MIEDMFINMTDEVRLRRMGKLGIRINEDKIKEVAKKIAEWKNKWKRER